MPTVNDNLSDNAARHTVYGLRWSMGTYRRHLHLIDTVIADLIYQLNVRAPESGSITEIRLQAMLVNVREASASLYSALNSAVTGDYRELAAFESLSQVAQIQGSYPITLSLNAIPPAQIHAAAMSQPFRGRVLSDWFAGQEIGFREQLSAAVRIGYAEGQSLSQIAARMRDIGGISRRDLESVIRTATQHMAARARAMTVNANADLFRGEVWSSTLDGRTSPVCIRLSGKIFPIGKGQYPPAHWNCRSSRIPVTKSWRELGFDVEDAPLSNQPFVADTRRVSDIPQNMRNQVIGTTSASTYSEFAANQPLSFLQDVAGDFRGQLAHDGGLPLSSLVRNGQWMTIDQIQSSESSAIQAAYQAAFG